MNTSSLQAQVSALESRVATLEGVEAIKKVQRAYGYYLEHGMCEELIALFSQAPDAALWHAGIGTYQGAAGIRGFFEGFSMDGTNPEFLHQLMIVSAIIDMAPDGTTAQGRWYGIGTIAMPYKDKILPTNIGVIYENDYVKEDAVWKIKVLRIYITYGYNVAGGGIVKPERMPDMSSGPPEAPPEARGFDAPDNTNAWYPSGYIVPFHFKHPVTGKVTTEHERNRARVPR